MDLDTLNWDKELLDVFRIPEAMLPRICSSGEVYGTVKNSAAKGIPIAGILGDQQAALVGQTCFKSGEAKNTYGTGCFLLMNTGERAVRFSVRAAHHGRLQVRQAPCALRSGR